MADLSVRWADPYVNVFGDRTAQLAEQFPTVLPRIINQVGRRAKTQVIRELTIQTGLPRKTIVKAIGNPTEANRKSLEYAMKTRGGDIRLKYLRPRETRAGVVAYPFGKRALFRGAFMKGGAFPARKTVDRFDGHVMQRVGKGRMVTFVRSHVFIPKEMTVGATKAAFLRVAGPLLHERINAALEKLL